MRSAKCFSNSKLLLVKLKPSDDRTNCALAMWAFSLKDLAQHKSRWQEAWRGETCPMSMMPLLSLQLEKENKCSPEGKAQSQGSLPAVGSKRSAVAVFRPVLQAQHEDQQLRALADHLAASQPEWHAEHQSEPDQTASRPFSLIRPLQVHEKITSRGAQGLGQGQSPGQRSHQAHQAEQTRGCPPPADSQMQLGGTKVKKRKVLLSSLKVMPSPGAPRLQSASMPFKQDKHILLPDVEAEVPDEGKLKVQHFAACESISSPVQQQNKQERTRQPALAVIFNGFFE